MSVHRLVRDDDGHWFIIPAANIQYWEAWIANYHNDPNLPTWAYEIDSPTNILFGDWERI